MTQVEKPSLRAASGTDKSAVVVAFTVASVRRLSRFVPQIDIRHLSLQTQAVWPTYLVRGGIAYGDGVPVTPATRLTKRRPKKGRQPARAEAALPSYFAQVASHGPTFEATEAALLAFYRTFGFLAPLERMRPGRRRRWSVSESVFWAVSHAKNVDVIMRLHRATTARHGGKLTDDEIETLVAGLLARQRQRAGLHERIRVLSFDGLEVPVGERQPLDPSLSVPRPHQEELPEGFLLKREAGESVRDFGQRIIAQLITPNLREVRTVYEAGRGGRPGRFLFHRPRLIDVIYYELAAALTSGTLRKCKCGRLFFAQDARQRVCPPPPGRRESLCGLKFRQQRRRAPAV